jgi:hypothetical protein
MQMIQIHDIVYEQQMNKLNLKEKEFSSFGVKKSKMTLKVSQSPQIVVLG